MSTCSECKFWNRNEDPDTHYDWETEEDLVYQHKTCFMAIHGNESPESRKLMLSAKAAVLDGSGYAARLKTLPTFGCNAFDALEQTTQNGERR